MIRYFIPADGDEPEHPNVFQLPSGVVGTGPVRFGDVKRNFPLPGQYHFRFKKKFGEAFVWVDMTEAGTMVPSCEGVFTAKITRLSEPATVGEGGTIPGQGMGMVPPVFESTRQGVDVVGGGIGGDDLLNMGHGSAQHAGSIPGPGSLGGIPQPDLLNMGMFDSSPPTGVAPPVPASAVPAGVGVANPLSRSPLMHPSPMPGQMRGVGVGVGPGGGFGWQQQQQQQQQQQHQHHPQQQQFARFPAQGRGTM